MEEKSGFREPMRLIGSILLSCVIGALLAAVAAAIILRYVAVESPSKRYDDVEKILAQYDEDDFRGVTIDPDGTLSIKLAKNDIYWYASEYGILDRFEQHLDDMAKTSGWMVNDYGFHVQEQQVVLHMNASRRLPAYYRVVLDVACHGTVMTLTPVEVAISGYMELPRERWPSLLPTEGFRLDFASMDISRCLRSVRLENGALVLEADGLAQALSGQLWLDRELLQALELYGCGRVDPHGILCWAIDLGTDKVPMAEAQERILSSGNAEATMAELLSCCTGLSRMEMFSGWDRFTVEFAAMTVEHDASVRRQELQRYIAAEQWKYEKLLTSIREMYKSGALSIGEKGFAVTQTGKPFDHTALTASLNITATDSRTVLLYTDLGGAKSIRTTDMPVLGDVPRVNNRSVKELDTERIYDIGMILTTENDVMVLIHYRNDGTFVLREVTEGQYTALLLSRDKATLNIDELYAPEDRSAAAAVSPTSQYEVILLP